MLPRVCLVETSVTQLAAPHAILFLCLPHLDFICDLLLNRRTTTYNLLVKLFFFYISQLNSKFVDIEIFPLLFESRDAPILSLPRSDSQFSPPATEQFLLN